MKNWTGNKKSTFSTLGASNHCEDERQEQDFYATSPEAIDALEKIRGSEMPLHIWETACGCGNLSKRLMYNNPNRVVYSSDIVQRGFPCEIFNFLEDRREDRREVEIITNPPYRYALEFVQRSLEHIKEGYHVDMFLKLTFLEGQKRKKFFEQNPPKIVAVFSKRMQVAKNNDPEMFKKSSAACYAWFIWEKGFKGEPTIKWI